MFRYDRSLLPNEYLAEREAASPSRMTALAETGLSMGYPAWNLLYYTALCSLGPRDRDLLVVETGTNWGFSTIILAQALKDAQGPGKVVTIDRDEGAVERAREHLAKAGLARWVEFNVADTEDRLERLASEVDEVDFAFLDASHEFEHVRREFDLVQPLIERARGKVFFDNTTFDGVARALAYIRERYGGNLVEFDNTAWGPPGNAIWQPA
jgi:predicted O-methyltransferase YrrM